MADNWDNEVAEMLKKQRKKYLQSENNGKMKILKEEANKIMESGQLTIIKEYIEDINDPTIKEKMSDEFNNIENKISDINTIEDVKIPDKFKELGHDLVQMKLLFTSEMTTLKNKMNVEKINEETLIKEYNALTSDIFMK